MYALWEVRPFTVSDSSKELRLRGSCGFESVTERDRDSFRMRPDGVRVVVVAVYDACIPNRGSASSVVVTTVPSGRVTDPVWSALRAFSVCRPAASMLVRVSESPLVGFERANVSVRPRAVVRVTVVGARLPLREKVCQLPSGRVSLVRKPSTSYS